MNICRETRNLVKIGQKYGTLHMKTYELCTVTGGNNLPYKHFCATINTFILLRVIRSSTLLIVAFTLQQSLREGTEVLCYMYIAYFFILRCRNS